MINAKKQILYTGLIFTFACGYANIGFGETWVNGQTHFANNRIIFAYNTDQQVTNITANLSGDVVSLDGSEKLTFGADAQINLDNGTLQLGMPVEGLGNVAVGHVKKDIEFLCSDELVVLPKDEANAQVIAKDVSLEDYVVDYGYYDWGNITKVCIDANMIANPFHPERGEGTFACQMQCVDGGWTKCVYLKLKQVDNTIVAWTPWAQYDAIPLYGKDFIKNLGNTFNLYQPGDSDSGYALNRIFLKLANRQYESLIITNSFNIAGTFSIEKNVVVEALGETALAPDSIWKTELNVNGDFRIRNSSVTNVSGNVTFGGYGRIFLNADQYHEQIPQDMKLANDMPGKTWAVVAENCSIYGITNATACIGGLSNSWFGKPGQQLQTFFFKRADNGIEISCEFQYDDEVKYVKGVIYHLRQANNNIEARVEKAGYWERQYGAPGSMSLWQATDMTVLDNYNSGEGYGIGNIHLFFDEVPFGRTISWNLIQLNSDVGELNLSGSTYERLYVKALSYKALQTDVTVGTNSILQYAFSQSGTCCPNNEIRIAAGGEVLHSGDWSVATDDGYLCISGGVFRLFYNQAASNYATATYVNNVLFADGGRFACHKPRSGYYRDPLWQVRGTHPAYIECGLAIVGNDQVALRTTTFDVDNVTGNDEVDLFIDGTLYYSNSQWVNAKLRKIGVGTVQVTGMNSVTNYPLALEQGTWLLAASNITTADNDIDMFGSTLALTEQSQNTLGIIQLQSASTNTLKLSDNSLLSISEFTPQSDSLLNVEATKSSAFRIGTTATLNRPQLNALRWNEQKVSQDSNGYIHPLPLATILFVR